MKRKQFFIILISFMLILSISACDTIAALLNNIGSTTNSEDPKIDQTAVEKEVLARMEQTRFAGVLKTLEAQIQITPEPNTDTPADDPTETKAPEPQPDNPEDQGIEVRLMGLSFTIPSGLNYTATIEDIEGDPDAMPPLAGHIRFGLNQDPKPDHLHSAQILVFPMHEVMEYYPSLQTDIKALNLLRTTGDFSMVGDGELPFLPIFPAMQVFHSNESAFEFQNGSGIRYLTMYTQGAMPVDTYNLFYTFQGVTDDQNYYVLGIIPILNSPLPAYISDVAADDIFNTNYDQYKRNLIDTLNTYGESNFTPNLELIDKMFKSLRLSLQ